MTLRDSRRDDDQRHDLDLIDEKAWEILGLTGEEFRRRWWSGEYRGISRPEILALDRLMRTGRWEP